ncbi:MAG: glycosyltransferase family 39 protein, partial [Hyphomicrobium sp.]
AFPGTFVAAALLGFLPATALLFPALSQLWTARNEKLARFLLAWIIGYIVYLEVLSSKPGTYTVQVMFPAMALAVALLVAQRDGAGAAPKGHLIAHLIPWPPLAAAFAIGLLALPYAVLGEWPRLWIMPFAAAVAALFYISAEAGRAGHLMAWAVSGIAALSLFAIALLSVVLPSIDRIWPAREIQRALAGCDPGPLGVLGYREPSVRFVLNPAPAFADADVVRPALVEGRPGYIAGETRDDAFRALNRSQYRRMKPLACVEAYNVMRGCPLYFTVVATGDVSACTARTAFPCTQAFHNAAAAARHSNACD